MQICKKVYIYLYIHYITCSLYKMLVFQLLISFYKIIQAALS